jgi:hypothetical protein
MKLLSLRLLERYVKTQVITPNEAREMLDLPQRPDGDGSTPFTMTPRQATDARANLAGDSSKRCQKEQIINSDSPCHN